MSRTTKVTTWYWNKFYYHHVLVVVQKLVSIKVQPSYCWFDQVPITIGCTEAIWNEELANTSNVTGVGNWNMIGSRKGFPYPLNLQIKGKGICLESRYLFNYTCSSDFTSPGSGQRHSSYWYYWSNLGSVHKVHIMAGWTKVVWNTKFTWQIYIWPALGIEH